MRLLLDTHTLFWWLEADPLLSRAAKEAIGNEASNMHVCAASAWEIAIEYRTGNWPEARDLAETLAAIVVGERLRALPVTVEHALHPDQLANEHRDPFDRLLAAQADLEQLTLATNDRPMTGFEIATLW